VAKYILVTSTELTVMYLNAGYKKSLLQFLSWTSAFQLEQSFTVNREQFEIWTLPLVY
jgi:hypothetical protein